MSDESVRKAIAYVNLVLAEHSLWPEDERTLNGAVSVLNRLL